MHRVTTALVSLFLLARVHSQHIGTNTPEAHPKITTQTCTKAGGCITQQQSIVLDVNWRWVHSLKGSTNCYTGNKWNTAICPDPEKCTASCAVEGADYAGTYGISTSGNALTLDFIRGPNVGSRTYLMAPDDKDYQMFNLNNQEFTFDVDMSRLPCGLNGALYFSEMAADGGASKYPGNKAGASYGTGYCDAQCPRDIKFINGEANTMDWTSTTRTSGNGRYGSCCNEMDIWEANSVAAAYTSHVCTTSGQTRINPAASANPCDKAGCDFNSYRLGDRSFLGPKLTVDTTSKFTVVTQFLTSDNTAKGKLIEIRRLYVQNGKVIHNSATNVAGISPSHNSITDAFCAAEASAFSSPNNQAANGGLANMGASFAKGMVLVMSIWDDYAANMLWLDSRYPPTQSPSAPGNLRGPCSTGSGKPADVEAQGAGVSVTYSNIKWGEIGSTFSGGSGEEVPKPATTLKTCTRNKPAQATTAVPPPRPSHSCAARYGQCDGIGWTGAKCCVAPYTCRAGNAYYSQCL